MRRKLTGTLFYGACLLAIGILLLALVAAAARRPRRAACPGSTRTSSPGCHRAGRRKPGSCPPSSARSSSGSSSALITFPIGIAAAIYLAEYAPDNRLNRLLQTNISNLAGVPSIIYGILGLALFVRLLGFGHVLAAGADPDPAHPAARDHRLHRGAQGRPRGPARGRLRARRDALADGPRVGPPGRRAGDHDRHHPGHGPGDRRGGPAHPDRRRRVRDVPAQSDLRAASRSCRSRSSTGHSARRPTSRASPPPRSS